MTYRVLVLTLAAVSAGILCVMGPVVMSPEAGACPPATVPTTASSAVWDSEQLSNAEIIVTVGADLGIPDRGRVIAVATAMQESSLRNLPHQGADNDHDSLGLFQQRPSLGWGTPEQIMDPRYASTRFHESLLQVSDWERLTLTEAAQAVQRSAYPDAYARWEAEATALVSQITGRPAAGLCAPVDGWVRPAVGGLTSGFRTANRPEHYGIDIAAPHGTTVRAAAADGVVTHVECNATLNGAPYSCDVDGSPQVAGCGWYLTIQHGEVYTRYCHLLTRPQVDAGETVAAGQQIGLVGSSGNSSGPHLHFEVEFTRPSTSTRPERQYRSCWSTLPPSSLSVASTSNALPRQQTASRSTATGCG